MANVVRVYVVAAVIFGSETRRLSRIAQYRVEIDDRIVCAARANEPIDQLIAGKIGGSTRFRSLQIGVCQESHGESIHRNMSWAGHERALPPEMIPHNLFDRIFGTKEQSWIDRKKSVLDSVRQDAAAVSNRLGQEDKSRVDEYLTSVRSVERAVASLPPEYAHEVERPEDTGDMRDWPRIAKLQSDLLAHALASGQTRGTLR